MKTVERDQNINKRSEESCAAAIEPAAGLENVKEILVDAKQLFKEKASVIVSAMMVSVERLVLSVEQILVPWRTFFVDTEDVQKIKQDLIQNPGAPKLVPLIRSLDAASTAVKSVAPKCGVDPTALISRPQNIIDQSEQIAASAAAVAIYVTSCGPAKTKTKLDSVKSATSTIRGLQITLPVVVQSRIQKVITMLDEELKKDGFEKEVEARRTSRGLGRAQSLVVGIGIACSSDQNNFGPPGRGVRMNGKEHRHYQHQFRIAASRLRL